MDKRKIKLLLDEMTENKNINLKLLKIAFENFNYKDEESQNILHILVDNKYNEEKCLLAIKTLLEYGINPNHKCCFGYNFIQRAIYTGYSEGFIMELIKTSLKYKLNINSVDKDGDTIMHTLIYSDNYKGEIINIYKYLCSIGFDYTILDKSNRNLIDALNYQHKTEWQYSTKQVEEFVNAYKNTKQKQIYGMIKNLLTMYEKNSVVFKDNDTKENMINELCDIVEKEVNKEIKMLRKPNK